MFLAFYADSACKNLAFSAQVLPARVGNVRGTPLEITLGGHTYKYLAGFENYMTGFVIDTDDPPAVFSAAFKRYPAPGNTLYMKNGLQMHAQEDDYDGTVKSVILNDFRYNTSTVIPGSGQESSATDDRHPQMYLVRVQWANIWYVGFTGWMQRATESEQIPCLMIEESFWTGAIRPPYDYGEGDTPDGGQGTGKFRRTGVGQDSAPTGGMPTGGRGLHYYIINNTAYQNLQGYLWGDAGTIAKSLWQKFLNKTHSPASCVIGCFTLPSGFMPTAGTASGVSIAGVVLPVNTGGGSCHIISPGFVHLSPIVFTAQKRPFECFADYTHVTAKMYVPFCGEIPIPIGCAYDRDISLQYRLDQHNGNISAHVYAGDIPIGDLSGNVAYNVPVSGGDTGTLERLGAAAAGILQISAGAVGGGLASLAESMTTPHSTQLINPDISGSASANVFRIPYIEWTYNKNGMTPQYWRTYGAVARVGGRLSDFTAQLGASGYGEFDIDIESVNIPGATDAEREEIKRLLSEGVYVQ